jgi:hypothetical protein
LKQEAAMLISGIGTSTVTLRASRRDAAAPESAAATESRALIPVAAAASGERSATLSRRPQAAFLAHLIATKDHAPQTRARRRAEPEEVSSVYEEASVRRGTTGRRLALNA